MTQLVKLASHPTGVAEIVIDRPARHNAMTLPMYNAMLGLIDQCAQDGLDAVAQELAGKLMGLSQVTQQAVKESLRRIVVEQRLYDDDLIETVYGSSAFHEGVASFTSGAVKK